MRERLTEVQEGMRAMLTLQESQLVKKLRRLESHLTETSPPHTEKASDGGGGIARDRDSTASADTVSNLPPAMGLILHSEDDDAGSNDVEAELIDESEENDDSNDRDTQEDDASADGETRRSEAA